MNRTRTFDNGKISVTFRTEQAAKDFDAFLEGEEVIYYGGEEIGRYYHKDVFDPYEFFGIRKDGEAD